MVYKCCIVPQCISTSIKTPQKLFVSVPTNAKRRKTWLKLSRRDPNGIKSHTNVFMCEDHLDLEKDIINYMQYKMGFSKYLFLADKAVPTKFHCQDRKKKKKEKTTLTVAVSSQETVLPNDLESNTASRDPLELSPAQDKGVQCRFCGQFSNDCVAVSGHMPYLAGHKTTLVINHIRIELDFSNDSLPKTVCRHCDTKLHEICEFVKQVNAAQFSLVTVTQKVNTQTVKAEFDNDDIDALTFTETKYVKTTPNKRKSDNTKGKIKRKKAKFENKAEVDDEDGNDALTFTKADYVKTTPNKRKSDNTKGKIKRKKAKFENKAQFDDDDGNDALTFTKADYVKKTTNKRKNNHTKRENTSKKKAKIEAENKTEFITDIKVEIIEEAVGQNPEYNDTGTDVKHSALELANSALVYQMSETSDQCNFT